jgi:hypothetical protein
MIARQPEVPKLILVMLASLVVPPCFSGGIMVYGRPFRKGKFARRPLALAAGTTDERRI